jgi:hypothetical protein
MDCSPAVLSLWQRPAGRGRMLGFRGARARGVRDNARSRHRRRTTFDGAVDQVAIARGLGRCAARNRVDSGDDAIPGGTLRGALGARVTGSVFVMVLSRIVLALLAGLQFLVASVNSSGNLLNALASLLLMIGAILSLACSLSPTRWLSFCCLVVNLGVICYLSCVNLTSEYPVTEVMDMLRIGGSAPLCAFLLSGWIWLKCPQSR